jgi:hypothetical protein
MHVLKTAYLMGAALQLAFLLNVTLSIVNLVLMLLGKNVHLMKLGGTVAHKPTVLG